MDYFTDKPTFYFSRLHQPEQYEELAVTDKPLHVRVAEALGCKTLGVFGAITDVWECACGPDFPHGCMGVTQRRPLGGGTMERIAALASYDTSWEATGPLIEAFWIEIEPTTEGPDGLYGQMYAWSARSVETDGQGLGRTPLVAVCNLILALSAAGKFRAEATLSPPSP